MYYYLEYYADYDSTSGTFVVVEDYFGYRQQSYEVCLMARISSIPSSLVS